MKQALHQPARFTLHLTISPEEALKKLAAEVDRQQFLTTMSMQDRKLFVAWIRGERFRLYRRPDTKAVQGMSSPTILHGSVKWLDDTSVLQGVFIVPSYADLFVVLLLVGTGLLVYLFVRALVDGGYAASILTGLLLLGCAGMLVAYLFSIHAARKRSVEEQRRITAFLEALFEEDCAHQGQF